MSISARFQQFKQSGVCQVGAVYIALGFALIQGADLIFPRLGLPDWIVTALIVLVLLGFPVALVLAWVFDIESRSDVATAELNASSKLRRPPLLAFGLVVVPVLGFGAWYAVSRVEGVGESELDPNLVAVLPFRVTGASDNLSYLREGMVDLLAAKLGGTDGVRAVDSRSVLAEWRKVAGGEQTDLALAQAVDVGRAVRAAQLLFGEIVGTHQKMMVTASLVAIRGEKVTQASVEGSADDLASLVDKLAAELLALSSGEDQRRMQSLIGTSLPAVRAYLEGRQDYRHGAYTDAIAHYRTALTHDSTFALAAYGMARAGSWVNNSALAEGNAIAWRHRRRLPPRDRMLFEASVSPRFPAILTGREWMMGAQKALRVAADDPEAWYNYGDALYHMGAVIGEERPMERAAEAFTRALELDSTFTPPLLHLADLAAASHDTAAVRHFATRSLAQDPYGESADVIRWLKAAAANDERDLAHTWERIDSIAPLTVVWIAGISQSRQVRLQDRDKYEAALDSPEEITPFLYFLNAGQPERALRAKGLQNKVPPADQILWMLPLILFGGVDSAHAPQAVAALAPSLRTPLSADSAIRARQYLEICALEEWNALRGDLATINGSIARLRSASLKTDGINGADRAHRCALFLNAIAAVKGKRTDARAAVERLEQAMLQGPMTMPLRYEGNLVLARLYDELGDKTRALAALRRRSRIGFPPIAFLSAYLREEGRLAVQVGDLKGARRAFSHYLAIRADPEPSARTEVEQVRRELAALGP